MKIFLMITAAVSFIGMIGDETALSRRNFTFGFMVSVAGIIALYGFGV